MRSILPWRGQTGLIVPSLETLTMLTIDGVTSNDEQDTLVATITWNLTPADLTTATLDLYRDIRIIIDTDITLETEH